jgi:hypothetical protein
MSAEILSGKRVADLVRECLPEEKGDPAVTKLVTGLTRTYGFVPESLEAHRSEIEAMIRELPDAFLDGPGGGGGYTFLGLCEDRHGRQWTDFHLDMEGLVCLAMAIGKAEFCMPREFWSAFPGGAPYIRFKQ